MHAIIKTGGKQYRVQPGDEIKIEKLADVNVGDDYTFESVLSVGDGEELKVGAPLIEGAKVTAKVLEQARDRKVIVFKKKRRKGYKKKRGHRQHYTRVRITGVEA